MTRTHAILAFILIVGLVVYLLSRASAPSGTEDIAQTVEITETPETISKPEPEERRPIQTMPSPKMSPPAVKQARLDGEAYRFVERQYDPPFVLPQYVAAPEPSALQTVESTLAVYTSAMQKSDWDWWFSMWDKESQVVITRLDQTNNGHPGESHYKERLLAGWKQFHAGRRYELVSRTDLPGYTLVYFRREGEPDDSRDLLMPVTLKKTPERWVMTHDLQEHIVPNLKLRGEDVEVRTIQ